MRQSKPGTIDQTLFLETLASLRDRIAARFPQSGLRTSAGNLYDFGQLIGARGTTLIRVPTSVRIVSWGGSVLVVGLIALPACWIVKEWKDIEQLGTFLQSLEAIVTVIAGALAAFFTVRALENSHKRRRSILLLHRLREMIHVIDMLQFSKSPSAILFPLPPTEASRNPAELLPIDQMFRYLTYCGALSAMGGKIALLIGNLYHDATVNSTVADIEELCADFHQKVQGKLILLEQFQHRSGKI